MELVLNLKLTIIHVPNILMEALRNVSLSSGYGVKQLVYLQLKCVRIHAFIGSVYYFVNNYSVQVSSSLRSLSNSYNEGRRKQYVGDRPECHEVCRSSSSEQVRCHYLWFDILNIFAGHAQLSKCMIYNLSETRKPCGQSVKFPIYFDGLEIQGVALQTNKCLVTTQPLWSHD